MRDFTELGSGFKIAMRDLTIRGAGDLLGSDQSGFIDTVGIDMYIEMLEEAIQAKKDGRKQEDLTPKPKTNIQQQAIFQRSLHQMTLISWICINDRRNQG